MEGIQTKPKGIFKGSGSRSVIIHSYAIFKPFLITFLHVFCLSTDIPARACLCGPGAHFHLEQSDNHHCGATNLRIGSQTPVPVVFLGNEMQLYYWFLLSGNVAGTARPPSSQCQHSFCCRCDDLDKECSGSLGDSSAFKTFLLFLMKC